MLMLLIYRHTFTILLYAIVNFLLRVLEYNTLKTESKLFIYFCFV